MLTSFYLFITPLVIVSGYVAFKFFTNREAIANMERNAFVDENEIGNNLEEAKEKVFIFFDNLRDSSFKSVILFLHWLLHFFVIFLRFISDITDVLYARSRDFFLHTASKEKKAVATFWPHLKEYRKEKDSENGIEK